VNERIKELAEQCESFGSWDNKTYSFDKEKFAELIIRECIDICMKKYDTGLLMAPQSPWIANQIKEHFGVEE
jgi:uncharacterized protein YutE (UPF0331/DUF86 family)